jgi:tetratricopeptide (TPR) repeat protein
VLAAAPNRRPPATRAVSASEPSFADLPSLLAGTPAESLVVPLRRFEADHARAASAGEAALVLGQLHYARGEYRLAAEAFARAAARLDPAGKPEARYWLGLSWLALGEPNQARSALEEVIAAGGLRMAEARLALAQTWELARRPERSAQVLEALVGQEPGEAGPAALERLAVLTEPSGHEDRVRKLRERLVREYPRSMEAAAARLTVFGAAAGKAPSGNRSGAVAVTIGSFLDVGRARSMAAAARAAGFPEAQVVTLGQAPTAVHLVRLGIYPGAGEARRAAGQAEKALGVTAQLSRP